MEKTYKEMPKQYVGFITDHSGSMESLSTAAMKDYNSNIITLREETNKHELDTIIFSVLCGVNPDGKHNYWENNSNLVSRGVVNSTVNLLKPITRYETFGRTPLFDSIGELITLMESVPDVTSPNVSFLIIAITDGLENASNVWTSAKLRDKIYKLQNTDRWTFTFRTPKGYAAALRRDLGVPIGNFYEWDQTNKGLADSHAATVASVKNYYTSRAAGTKSTGSFYTDLSNVSVKEVKSALDDITSQVTAFKVTPVYHNVEIREFLNSRKTKGTKFKVGAGFYELTKREKVQEYKQIIIQNISTKKFYGGQAARSMLGLSSGTGTLNVNPGDHGDFKIFIQSTSVNRKLKEHTQLVYWPDVVSSINPSSSATNRRY